MVAARAAVGSAVLRGDGELFEGVITLRLDRRGCYPRSAGVSLDIPDLGEGSWEWVLVADPTPERCSWLSGRVGLGAACAAWMTGGADRRRYLAT